MIVVRRSLMFGALLVVVAALFKLPFVVIGLLAFAHLRSLWQRLAAATLTLGAALIVSYRLGGPHYFATLAFYNHWTSQYSNNVLGYALAGIALAALLWAS